MLQCRTVHIKKQKIVDTPLAKDFLQDLGFSYNEETFDDLFVKGWAKAEENSTDSSSEELQMKDDREEEKA